MSANKIAIILIYATIFIMLISPNMHLPQNMIEIGAIHLYLFEIPLIAVFLLSPFIFRKFNVNKDVYTVCSLFCLIAIIGLVGGIIYASVRIQTILSDIRYIFYWLVGILLLFIGHKHLQLKTLTWVVAAGLMAQFFMSLILLKTDPSILWLTGHRFPGRSAWLALYFIAIFFIIMNYRKKSSSRSYIKITPIVLILIPLLMFVLLCQNRTTWLALSLMILYSFAFNLSIVNKIKFLFAGFLIILLIFLSLQNMPYSDSIRNYMYKRFTYGMLSEEGVLDSWEGNREAIYKSNFEDFKARPLLGNGFGHEMYFDFSTYGKTKEDKIQKLSDNSFVNVIIQTGLVGFIIFALALYKIYSTIKRAIAIGDICEEWIYLRAMVLAYPFLILVSLNISILYGYPEVMIISLVFSKAALLAKEFAKRPHAISQIK